MIFKKYKRNNIAEMHELTDKDNLSADFFLNVSISPADMKGGSPKVGDMIARNPKNHNDMWLVAKDYFKENFEES